MKKPLVGIIMGSDSDLPVMKEAAKICEHFGIEYEVTVVSAHRTPERLFKYSKEADKRGIRVIIAGLVELLIYQEWLLQLHHFQLLGFLLKLHL